MSKTRSRSEAMGEEAAQEAQQPSPAKKARDAGSSGGAGDDHHAAALLGTLAQQAQQDAFGAPHGSYSAGQEVPPATIASGAPIAPAGQYPQEHQQQHPPVQPQTPEQRDRWVAAVKCVGLS